MHSHHVRIILSVSEVVEHQENDAGNEADNKQIAKENINMDINRRETELCWL